MITEAVLLILAETWFMTTTDPDETITEATFVTLVNRGEAVPTPRSLPVGLWRLTLRILLADTEAELAPSVTLTGQAAATPAGVPWIADAEPKTLAPVKRATDPPATDVDTTVSTLSTVIEPLPIEAETILVTTALAALMLPPIRLASVVRRLAALTRTLSVPSDKRVNSGEAMPTPKVLPSCPARMMS